MNSSGTKWLRFFASWLINTLAVALTALLLHGHIQYKTKGSLLLAALLLGILNAFVRPILTLLALPLVIFTLGLFYFVINALLLYFISYLMYPAFQVDTFSYAFFGAALISAISTILNVLTGNGRGRGRITVRRQNNPPPPRDRNDGPGGGPVIDV